MKIFCYNDKSKEWSKESYHVVGTLKEGFIVLIGTSFFFCALDRAKFAKWEE